MKSLPLNDDTIALAKRIIWFEAPQQALADPVRLLAYAFKYADIEDISALRTAYSEEDLRNALINAPPGIIDARSWAYWNLILRDLSPPPPMPTRTFDETKASNL
jgi:hypothetical protein